MEKIKAYLKKSTSGLWTVLVPDGPVKGAVASNDKRTPHEIWAHVAGQLALHKCEPVPGDDETREILAGGPPLVEKGQRYDQIMAALRVRQAAMAKAVKEYADARASVWAESCEHDDPGKLLTERRVEHEKLEAAQKEIEAAWNKTVDVMVAWLQAEKMGA